MQASENVGRNLQDHIGINYTFKGRQPTLNQLLRPWWGKLWVGLQYVLLRSGPLSLSMNNAGGFFRTGTGQERPNMQLYFQAFSTVIPKAGNGRSSRPTHGRDSQSACPTAGRPAVARS